MKRIRESTNFIIAGIALYKDELEEVVDHLKEEISSPTISTDKYEFNDFEEFKLQNRDYRPMSLKIYAIDKSYGSIDLKFSKDGARISCYSDEAKTHAIASELKDILLRHKPWYAYRKFSFTGFVFAMIAFMLPIILGCIGIFLMIYHQEFQMSWWLPVRLFGCAFAIIVFYRVFSRHAWANRLILDKTRREQAFWETSRNPFLLTVLAGIFAILATTIAALIPNK